MTSAELKPVVSIVVVTYNRAGLILDSLQSVIQQSFSNWEMIIVDDGSTDHTFELIKGLRDPRIHYHYIFHSGQLGYIRNLGIRLARGEFIAFQDSDDLWREDKLQFQLDLFNKHPEIDYILSNSDQIGEHAVSLPSYKKDYAGKLFKTLLIDKDIHFCGTSLIFRTSIIGKIGMLDESIPRMRELHFFYRMSYAFTGLFTIEKLVKVRRHANNTSHTYREKAHQTMIRMLEEFLSEGMLTTKQYKKLVTDNLYTLGLHHLRDGQPRKAAYDFKHAIRLHPFKGKAWVRLIQSIVLGIRS